MGFTSNYWRNRQTGMSVKHVTLVQQYQWNPLYNLFSDIWPLCLLLNVQVGNKKKKKKVKEGTAHQEKWFNHLCTNQWSYGSFEDCKHPTDNMNIISPCVAPLMMWVDMHHCCYRACFIWYQHRHPFWDDMKILFKHVFFLSKKFPRPLKAYQQ